MSSHNYLTMLKMAMVIICIAAAQCLGAAAAPALFTNGQNLGAVNQLKEASGLAMSRLHKDVLYTHSDQGEPVLYALNSTNGRVIAKLKVQGAINNDWEDIAVGQCGPDSCIYIGDTGDKNSNSARNVVYRVKETTKLSDLTVEAQASFSWEFEDAETLMAEPDGDVWLIPKVKKNPKLFKLKRSDFGGKKVDLTGQGTDVTIDLGGKFGPTGGDMSSDGKQMLLRTKEAIWLYQITDRITSIREALATPPVEVPVEAEPQGEAVCWNVAGDGYYTLSEGLQQPLYFYRQASPAAVVVG